MIGVKHLTHFNTRRIIHANISTLTDWRGRCTGDFHLMWSTKVSMTSVGWAIPSSAIYGIYVATVSKKLTRSFLLYPWFKINRGHLISLILVIALHLWVRSLISMIGQSKKFWKTFSPKSKLSYLLRFDKKFFRYVVFRLEIVEN